MMHKYIFCGSCGGSRKYNSKEKYTVWQYLSISMLWMSKAKCRETLSHIKLLTLWLLISVKLELFCRTLFLFCFATCFYGNMCNYVITVLYQYKMEWTVIVDATLMYTYLGMSRLHHLDFSHY